MTYDVVVVGAGIVGCAAAVELAQAGVRVAVFDAGPIGAGASGRNAGLVEHPFDREQVALHDETVAILRDVLGDAFPTQPTGVLLLFEDERGAEQAVREAAAFPELTPELLAPDAVVTAEPSVRPGLWGCWMQTGYPVRPEAAVRRFAELARDRGATFVTDTPVALLHDGDGTVRGVVADGEAHRADVVLVAAGAASSALVDPTGQWQPVRPLWGVSVNLESAAGPRIPLVDGRSEGSVPSAFSLIPTPEELALGSTWLDDEPDGISWIARLGAEAAAFWPPVTEAAITGVRVCARPHAFDGRPLLGRVAGHRTLWTATGHGGRGVSTGAATARLIAATIIAGDDRDVPPALRADRAGPPPVTPSA
ncbi:NAD(P)/FAD-dependent oxidoreductase [Baekduia sp. Peel2402]|uniref:NAD(P)/FAD-dependent oxidoreductase n=1 Tax=Baekduia sp. Peel2402 TaxID=3458296 RepID=UPI00403EE0CE